MQKALGWARNGLALVGMLALGFWLGAGRTVKASSYENGGNVEFQLAGVNETSSLLVYQPSTKTVYVYRGATQGNSALQCSYKFQMETPGGVIQRVPCPVQTAIP
ncbi:MAG: hypothetical protein WCA11_16600 [Terracidiphilus sp.]